jgi:hypothetical protein
MVIEEDMPFEPAVDIYVNDEDLLNINDDNLNMEFDSNLNKLDESLRQ